MLNRLKMTQALDRVLDTIFVDNQPHYEIAQQAWRDIADDQLFWHKVHHGSFVWAVPSWREPVTNIFSVCPIETYTVVGVDGSQIYPDRHQGVSCFLINIGTVLLSYNTGIALVLSSEPFVMNGYETEFPVCPELVNSMRQEFELKAPLEQPIRTDTLVLLDGALLCWHLEGKEDDFRHTFLSRYHQLLTMYERENRVIASYISRPKGRELSNLVRLKLANFDTDNREAYGMIERIGDAALMSAFLAPGQRSIVFGSRAPIGLHGPASLRTHFFYMHNGDEIGRVEIPAWIAADECKVDWVARVILDQCAKGRGYPIVLAEAHEQAVVKGPDREFFYHLLQKRAFERAASYRLSQKSASKRTMLV